MTDWFHRDSTFLLMDGDSPMSTLPRANLLFIRKLNSLTNICQNPVTVCTLKDLAGSQRGVTSSIWTPVCENLDFVPGCDLDGSTLVLQVVI